MSRKQISTPLTAVQIDSLEAGDQVAIDGILYAARDAAHKRMLEALSAGRELPFEIRGQVIYYVGPAPARPGAPIGSAGPTTSGRMDRYTPELLRHGLKGMIGKGYRSPEVVDAIRQNRAIYFAAVGGSGALLARHIQSAEVVAYEDLGPEAIYRLEVVEFPAIVVNDCHGNDLYQLAPQQYRE